MSSIPAHLRKPSKGDYLVVQVRRENEAPGPIKTVVIKTTRVNEDTVLGVIEKTCHLSNSTVEVSYGEIVCNMGSKPPHVKAFNTDFSELFVGTKDHPKFGDIHFFYNPKPETGKRVWRAYDAMATWLSKNGLGYMLELPIVYEVRSKKGKFAGEFRGPKNNDYAKTPARIWFNPEHKSLQEDGPLTYVLAHELGHAVDMMLLIDHPKLKAEWLDMYVTTVEPLQVTEEDYKLVRKALLSSDTVKLAASLMESEECSLAFKGVMGYISKVRGISASDLNLILSKDKAEKLEALKELLPRVDIFVKKNPKPLVTGYATENVRELFAEAFAFYVQGKKLPKSVQALMERSVQAAIKSCKRLQAEGGFQPKGKGEDEDEG